VNFRESGTPLQAVLTDLLSKKKITRADFAKLVGLTKGTLSRLEHKQPPKLPRRLNIGAWAEKLNLNETERHRLQLAAEITWSPALVQELVRQQPKSRQSIIRTQT
jgi:transcriptional regulator with XRE-family HTH domain